MEKNRTVERLIEYYNLDAILSVGYRVKSKQGTQFRMWAIRVLKDHLAQGYTVNARRLKELHQAVHVVIPTASNSVFCLSHSLYSFHLSFR